jgi:hypothetical protein
MPMDRAMLAPVLAAVLGCSGNHTPSRPPPLPDAGAGALRPPEAFAAIRDPVERSRALFLEASKVLLHPRCVNCHPPDDSPRQGDQGALHDPPVFRGPDDHGVPALECQSCHQDRNAELARIPGAPGWHLAPVEMTWLGRSAGEICAQLKDPARNGGKTLAAIHDHMAHDPLVAWGWAPGDGRTPAPGTQERFGALIGAWIEAGAACPPPGEEAR